MSESFTITFFRLYDRKIASGEITFQQTGITKASFTKLCTDKEFVPPRAEVERLCSAMKLTEEECESLLQFAEEV